MLELDHFDLALLDVLQRFGRATHQQLGEQVPLSPSQIGRRLQRLEASGVIEGYRVVLRSEKLRLGVTAFTSLKLKHHGDSTIEQFQQQIDMLPEVLECHETVGDADYLLRIVAPDLNALSGFVVVLREQCVHGFRIRHRAARVIRDFRAVAVVALIEDQFGRRAVVELAQLEAALRHVVEKVLLAEHQRRFGGERRGAFAQLVEVMGAGLDFDVACPMNDGS